MRILKPFFRAHETFIIKLFKIPIHFTIEETINRELLLLFVLFDIISLAVGLIFAVAIYLKIFISILIVILITYVVLFVILHEKYMEIFTLVMSICFHLQMLFLIFFRSNDTFRGLIFNDLYYSFVMIPILNIFLNAKFMYVWIVVYFMLFIAGYVVDMIMVFPPSDIFNEDDSFRFKVILKRYVWLAIIYSFFFLCLYLKKYILFKERDMIKKLSVAISKLDLESLIEMKKRSLTRGFDSLKIIVRRMKHYRSFLPTLIVNDSDVDEDEEDLIEEEKKKKKKKGKNRLFSSILQPNSKPEHTTRSFKHIFVDRKRITLLHIKIILNEEELNCQLLGKIFHDFFASCLDNIIFQRGTIVNFFNNNLYICWNAIRKSVNPVKRASNVGLMIISKCKKNYDGILKVHMSMTENDFFFGNMGTDEFGRFNIFSDSQIISDMESITDMNEEFNSNFLVERKIFEKLKYDYILKQVEYDESTEMELFDVTKKKKSDDEWIYLIGEKLEKGKEDKFEYAWNLYKQKKYQETLDMLEKDIILSKIAKKYTSNLKRKCLQKLKGNNSIVITI